MKLQIANPIGKDYREVSSDPSEQDIWEYVSSMPWQDISAARLVIDLTKWIELSGSTNDGFAIIYSDDEKEWITEEPPETLEEGIEALQSYAAGRSDWLDSYDWSEFNKAGSTGPNATGGCASMIVITFLIGALLASLSTEKNDANQAVEATTANAAVASL